MPHAPRSERNDDQSIEETARTHFSHCPFCGTDYPMTYEQNLNERHVLCRNCRRKWRVSYTLGTVWFTRTNDPKQEKRYTSSWIVNRADRSLEGIRPYILLETDSRIGKQKIQEQGLDKFLWEVQPLLDYFDRYDRLIKAHSCERIKVAFACARRKTKKEHEPTPEPGLSVKQVAAITNLPEHEASNCMQRLLNEGLISYEVRPEKGPAGIEAIIVGFLGEPLYQMNEHTAEKTLKELMK